MLPVFWNCAELSTCTSHYVCASVEQAVRDLITACLLASELCVMSRRHPGSTERREGVAAEAAAAGAAVGSQAAAPGEALGRQVTPTPLPCPAALSCCPTLPASAQHCLHAVSSSNNASWSALNLVGRSSKCRGTG